MTNVLQFQFSILLNCSLDEREEQRMGLEHGAVVLRIVLYTDIPGMSLNLDSLYKLGVGVDTRTLHACSLELILVLLVEFVAVMMTLLDAVHTIDFLSLIHI